MNEPDDAPTRRAASPRGASGVAQPFEGTAGEESPSDDPRSALVEMCGAVAAAVRQAWGRGPANTRAYWAGRDTLVVLMRDSHTAAERALLANGDREHVLERRRCLHAIVADELKAIVQRATGRRVSGLLNAVSPDHDLSAEIFLLDHQGGGSASGFPPA